MDYGWVKVNLHTCRLSSTHVFLRCTNLLLDILPRSFKRNKIGHQVRVVLLIIRILLLLTSPPVITRREKQKLFFQIYKWYLKFTHCSDGSSYIMYCNYKSCYFMPYWGSTQSYMQIHIYKINLLLQFTVTINTLINNIIYNEQIS